MVGKPRTPTLGAAGGVWTIVLAAGSGRRFGGPKQYADIGGQRVLDRSLAVARDASDGVVVVLPAHDVHAPGEVAGGETRSESVRAGLAAVPHEAPVICVHDAARPFASVELYAAVVAAIGAGADGAVPALPVSDTIKRIAGDVVVETLDRSTLVAVQTPQAFRAAALRAAHLAVGDATDDAGLVEAAGGRVVVVPGEPDNRKITDADDLTWARHLVESGR